MSEYYVGGTGLYQESGTRQLFISPDALILDPLSTTGTLSPSSIVSGEAANNTAMMRGTIQSEA